MVSNIEIKYQLCRCPSRASLRWLDIEALTPESRRWFRKRIGGSRVRDSLYALPTETRPHMSPRTTDVRSAALDWEIWNRNEISHTAQILLLDITCKVPRHLRQGPRALRTSQTMPPKLRSKASNLYLQLNPCKGGQDYLGVWVYRWICFVHKVNSAENGSSPLLLIMLEGVVYVYPSQFGHSRSGWVGIVLFSCHSVEHKFWWGTFV